MYIRSHILLRVYKGDYTPYTYHQKAYKRMDTSTVQVDRHSYEELILLVRNSSFEELPADSLDLDFKYFTTRLKNEIGIQQMSDDLLVALGLKPFGRYNKAAMLISDKNPMKNAEINLIAYKNDSVLEIKDRQILNGMSVLEQFDKCMDFYSKHINIREIIDGPYRKTIEEIPLVAYREPITRSEIEKAIGIGKSQTIELINQLRSMNLVSQIGRGPSTAYVITDLKS